MRSEQGKCPGRQWRRMELDHPAMPPEVAELTVRLRREADRLAAHYPATACRTGIVAAPPSAAPVLRISLLTAIAVGILVAASALPLVRPPIANTPDQLVRNAASDGLQGSPATDLPQPAAPGPIAPGGLLPAPWDPFAERPAAAVLLLRVSNPELEAVLDLWKNGPEQTTRLSI